MMTLGEVDGRLKCAHCGGRVVTIVKRYPDEKDGEGVEVRALDIYAECERCLCSDRSPIGLRVVGKQSGPG